MNPERMIDRLETYWLEVTDASTLVLVRTFYGLVCLAWGATLLPDVNAISRRDGLARADSVGPVVSVFRWLDLDRFAYVAVVSLMVSAFLVVIGIRVRVTVPVTALLVASLVDASLPWAIGAEFVLVLLGVHLAVFSLLTPSHLQGHHAWARDSRGVAPRWGLRLLQIQIAIGYATTAIEKARGDDWTDGSAVFHALASDTLRRFEVPGFVFDVPVVIAVLTYATLAIEASLPVLLLWPVTRRWAVLLAVSLHVGFEVFLTLGFFAPAMTIGILAFVPERDSARVLDVAARLGGRARRGRRTETAPVGVT